MVQKIEKSDFWVGIIITRTLTAIGWLFEKIVFSVELGVWVKKKYFSDLNKLFFSIFTYNPIIHYSKNQKFCRIDLKNGSENRKKWFLGWNHHNPNSNRYWVAFWKNRVFCLVGGLSWKKKSFQTHKNYFSRFSPIIL